MFGGILPSSLAKLTPLATASPLASAAATSPPSQIRDSGARGASSSSFLPLVSVNLYSALPKAMAVCSAHQDSGSSSLARPVSARAISPSSLLVAAAMAVRIFCAAAAFTASLPLPTSSTRCALMPLTAGNSRVSAVFPLMSRASIRA